jgi:pimeloyl-ACP methyl ester carboxylesterase
MSQDITPKELAALFMETGKHHHEAFKETNGGDPEWPLFYAGYFQARIWDRLGEIRCPVLVLVGENDAKFTALGQRIVAGVGDGRLLVVPGSGHTVHLEQPNATAVAVTDFLR